MKTTIPMVSVIVPIYRMEKYLQQCINSICRQSYIKLEIILINDGSPDLCGEICDKNAIKDSRIVVVHKENGGLSSARNAGLDIATGDYIAFVDADDMLHPRFIEILVSLCEKYNCDIAQCDFLSIMEDSYKLPLNPQKSLNFYVGKDALYNLCGGKNFIKYSVVWNKIYKKELFAEIRFPFGKIHEDEFVNYLLFWKAKKIVDTNQYMYYYLRHEKSIMGKPFSIERLDVLEALKSRLIFLKENGLKKEYICILYRLFYLIEEYSALLKENIENYETIFAMLQKERENIVKQIPEVLKENTDEPLSQSEMIESCFYSKESKIVLYGAGKFGRIYYQWIKEHHQGIIVGWVDNLWYTIKDIDYPITPIDSLLSINYDYILIAIKSKQIQEEITQNLIGWGIPKEKIRLISTNEL